MAVITISRELGSGGTDISKQVAQALSYKLVDKEFIEAILRQYGMTEFEKLYQSTASIWARYDSANMQLVKMLNKTILAIAQRDRAVILGRGGFAILHEYANVLNVRIQAPLADRVQFVMQNESMQDYHAAEEYVKENDRVRDTFVQAFYGIKWENARYFNLVIDTSQIPRATAVNWIIEAAHSIDQLRITAGKNTREIEVDVVLEKTVREQMDRQG